MKISILIVAITVVLLTVLSATGFFIYKNLNKPEVEEGATPVTVGTENLPSGGEKVLKEISLIKDDFEITLPFGWQEATTSLKGILAMAVDAKEDVSGGNFQKLDFRTNLSVKNDDITKYASVSSFEDYVASVKTSLIQAVPTITFNKETAESINGAKAIFVECSSRQEEVDFKTLLVFIQGGDHIIYAISFNTFQSSWLNYQGVFEQIARSFKFRYGI